MIQTTSQSHRLPVRTCSRMHSPSVASWRSGLLLHMARSASDCQLWCLFNIPPAAISLGVTLFSSVLAIPACMI